MLTITKYAEILIKLAELDVKRKEEIISRYNNCRFTSCEGCSHGQRLECAMAREMRNEEKLKQAQGEKYARENHSSEYVCKAAESAVPKVGVQKKSRS